MPKSTVLNRLHRAAGARMVDFGGWDMPLSYGSQIDEHHAVRRSAGMFDVSHMRAVDVRGNPPAPRDLLRFALANNVDKLKTPGKALYSCLLSDDGGVLDDLIVYFLHEDWFRLVVNAATTAKDLAWVETLVAERAPGVKLLPRDDLAMIAVQGPEARAKTWAAIPGSEAVTAELAPFSAVTFASRDFGELFVARTGYTGEDGFEITVPAVYAESLWTALAGAGVVACGLGARDTLRLEAGMNLYGQDMDESVSPLETGLAWTVDLVSERNFSGKAALMAAKPARRLAGLVLRDTGGVLRAHQVVHTSAGAGEVTSGTWSPTLGKSIALARLPAEVPAGTDVEVEVRGKRLAARVVKPPFVRHGVALIS